MAAKKKFSITDTDKAWVDENFSWLIEVYGYPSRQLKTILLTEEFFPETLAAKQTSIAPLLADLCRQFNIDYERVSFETEEDIRDSYGTPYEFRDKPFECEVETVSSDKGRFYKFFFAKTLLTHPKRLLFNCVYHFIKIHLAAQKIEDEEVHEDGHLFIYLAGIYMMYGVILSQTMADSGRQISSFWEAKWNHAPELPEPVMAYAMALNYSLVEEINPAWKKFLPASMQVEYDKAAEFIHLSPNPLFNKQELIANDLYLEGDQHYVKNDFDAAIVSFQKALFLTTQNHLRANLFNNIGYNWLRKQEYLKSIAHFQKALEINSSFGYANDNLGFAFIMSGDLNSGKHYLNVALQTENNDHAYSFRNMALYHQKRGEMKFAEENFKKAFESMSIPVDLLEYFYAIFLLESGEKDKAMSYLKMAVDKGEPEAIDFMTKNYTN